MHVLVPIKRVVDYNVKIRVKSDQSGVETANVKMSINPFDEIAIEEAVRKREAGQVQTITLVTIGPKVAAETLRAGLVLGADQAIHVETDARLEPLMVAKMLQKVVVEVNPNLVIMGKQAIDDDYNQTGQMLAALLNWPQATFASNLTIAGDICTVVREVDGGLETIEVKLPAIITTDLRLNEPRYATLPNIMKAKQKPLTVKTPTDLGIEIQNRLEILKVTEPSKRQGGIMVESVAQLVDKLHESKVI